MLLLFQEKYLGPLLQQTFLSKCMIGILSLLKMIPKVYFPLNLIFVLDFFPAMLTYWVQKMQTCIRLVKDQWCA